MKEFRTIKKDGVLELDVKKSRFICYLKRVESEEEARNYIASIKKEHHKANHNCSAFILGENSEIKRSSDDGEPSGTAGIPMLNVLEKQEVTNVVAVVTRYFGGIKLGAGGLIRAYAGAVSEAIQFVGRVEVKELRGLSITLSYSQYQEFASWCASKGITEHNPQFLEQVTTTLFVQKDQVKELSQDLLDFYHGKVDIEQAGLQVMEEPII